MTATKFKETCLSLLDTVDEQGIVITTRGRPVAKLIPIRRSHAHLIGSMRGRFKIKGDILGTGVKWDAQS